MKIRKDTCYTLICVAALCGLLYLESSFIFQSQIYSILEIVVSLLIPIFLYRQELNFERFIKGSLFTYLATLICFDSFLFIQALRCQDTIQIEPQIICYSPPHGYRSVSGIRVDFYGKETLLPYSNLKLDSLYNKSPQYIPECLKVTLYVKKIEPYIYYVDHYHIEYK